MRFTLRPMTAEDARAIASWRYGGAYAFYDPAADEADLAALLDPANWREAYKAVDDERGALAGFFTFERAGDDVLVGLGLRPDLTGRGLSARFLEAGLAEGARAFRPRAFRLAVAAWNARARRAYEKAGFVEDGRFSRFVGHDLVEFVTMRRPAP